MSFVQVHSLHSYSGVLLNRDDSGLAKMMEFGGHPRTRISSQCLKRHWRDADQHTHSFASLADGYDSYRSREIVERLVLPALLERASADEDVVRAVCDGFILGLYGKEPQENLRNRQPLLMGWPEVNYLIQKGLEICGAHPNDTAAASAATADLFKRGAEGDNFRAFRNQIKLPSGLIGAMFGRMVTSDTSANIEAAIHVAHSFTVHAQESENDYFTSMDDLRGSDEEEAQGAAFIGNTEINSGIFYGYTVVDLRVLCSNLEGCSYDQWQSADRELAANLVRNLIHIIATVSPGAKRGSTAPYSHADFMMVEFGRDMPRQLANAFRKPVQPDTDAAVQAMATYLESMDKSYGIQGAQRQVMTTTGIDIPGAYSSNLPELANWAAELVTTAGEAK